MTKITDDALKKLGFTCNISESDGAYARFQEWQHAGGHVLRWAHDHWSLNGEVVDDVEDLKNRTMVKPCY